MKKMILTSIALCFVLILNAQIVKIQPKFEIGKDKYYLCSIRVLEGDKDYKVILLQRIKVLSSDKDGFTMETEIVEKSMDYNRRTFDTDFVEAVWKSRLNNIYKFRTNADGEIKSLLNADEVMKKGEENLGELWDVVFWGKYPELFTNMTQQLALRGLVYSGLSEEGFINWMSTEPFLFSLYGKEFINKQQYLYHDKSGLKMQRTIGSLSFDEKCNLIIKIKDKLDMSQEERKQVLYKQLKEAYPDQINNIKFDEVYKASGWETYKKEMSFYYELDPGFWPIEYICLEVDDKHSTKYKFWGLSDDEVHELIGR